MADALVQTKEFVEKIRVVSRQHGRLDILGDLFDIMKQTDKSKEQMYDEIYILAVAQLEKFGD